MSSKVMLSKLNGTNGQSVYWKRRHMESVYRDVRKMGTEAFMVWMNEQLTKSYQIAEQHYQEAIFIEPKQPASTYLERVKSRVEKIRQEWDGIQTVVVEEDGDAIHQE